MHGTSGTTRSEGCLLVYSVVGKSLIFPIRPFALLPTGSRPASPGSEAGSMASLPEFCGSNTVLLVLLPQFSGRRVP